MYFKQKHYEHCQSTSFEKILKIRLTKENHI